MNKSIVLVLVLATIHGAFSQNCATITSDVQGCVQYKYINQTTLQATALVNGEEVYSTNLDLNNPQPVCTTAYAHDICLDYRPSPATGRTNAINVCSTVRVNGVLLGSKKYDLGCSDVPTTTTTTTSTS